MSLMTSCSDWTKPLRGNPGYTLTDIVTSYEIFDYYFNNRFCDCFENNLYHT